MNNKTGETLQKLIDSEINLSLTASWNGGFSWQIGDFKNGNTARGNAATLLDAIKGISESAVDEYPDSNFAKWHKSNQA